MNCWNYEYMELHYIVSFTWLLLLILNKKETTSLAFKQSIFISGLLLPTKAASGLGLCSLTLTILLFLPLQTSYNLLSVLVYFKAGLLVTVLYFTSRNLLLPEMISLDSLVRDNRTRNAISGLSRISDRTLISAFNNTESKVH